MFHLSTVCFMLQSKHKQTFGNSTWGLVSSKRHLHGGDIVVVDEASSSLQVFYNTMCSLNISGESETDRRTIWATSIAFNTQSHILPFKGLRN